MHLDVITAALVKAASFSICKDKKVGAIAVKNNMVVSIGFNIKDPKCNGLCDHSCAPIHAEHELNAPAGSTVYLTLDPCEHCQRRLYQMGVKKIVVFGHKVRNNLGLLPIEEDNRWNI